MELHTLGVGAGYSQQDVQQLALILTGAGLAYGGGQGDGMDRAINRRQPPGIGSGVDEITQAVDLIVQQPACATYVSGEIAEYFVADAATGIDIDAMAKTFRHTDGDIASVLRTMFLSKQFAASLGADSTARKFKDPTQFLVSAMRLAYDGRPISNAQPLVNWLNQMGEPVFGRITPDGWPMEGASWSSSGQMAKRFEVARAIGRLISITDEWTDVPRCLLVA
ncbi:MAG: hypothetical protein WDW36_000151 [Sanguina aurantia]